MANEDKKKSATLKALKEAGDEFYNRAVTNPKKVDDFITKTTVSLRTLYNVLDKYIKAAADKTKAMAKRGANTAMGKGVDVVDAAKRIHSDVKEKGFTAVVRDGFNRADDSLSERIKSLTAAATAPPEQELTTKERLKGLLSSGKDYVTSNMSKAKDTYTEAKENVKNTFEQERLKVVLSDLDTKDRIRIRILKEQDVPKEGCKVLNTRLGRIELSELNYEKVEDGESYLITNNFMIKSNDEAAITIRLYNPEEQAEGRKPGSFMARFGSLFRPPVEDSDEAKKKKEEKEKAKAEKRKNRSLGTKTLLSSMTDLMQGNFILGLTKLGLVPAAYTVPFVLKGLSRSLPAGLKGAGNMISFLAKPFLPKFLKGGKSKEDKKKEQKEKDGQESQGFFSRLKDKMTGRKKEVEDEKAASKEGLKKKKGKDLGILGMILSAVTGLLTIGPKQIASMLGSGLWWLTKQIGKGLWWGVRQLGNFIWDKTKALGRAIGTGLGKVKDKVVGKLAEVGTKIKTSVLNIGSKLGKGLTAVKDGVFNVGKNIFSFGSNMLAHGKNLLDGVKNIVPGITQGLGGVFRSVMGGLSSAFGTLGGKLVTGIYTVTTKITELATIIPRAISGLFKFGGGKAAEAAGGKAVATAGGKVLAKALGPIGAGIDVADGMSDLMSGNSQESISGFEWLSPMRIGMYIGDKFNKAWEAMTGGTSLGNSIYNLLNEDPMAKMDAEQKARDAERLKAQEASAKPKQQAQTNVPAAAPKPAAVPVGAERGFFGKMYDSAVDYTSRGIEAVAKTASEVTGSLGVVASGTWNTLKGKPKEIENMVIASLQKEGITDPKTMSYIMGQLAHETGNFRYMEEIASGAKYEGRRDLGNSSPGDGVKYKGRGVIQITGKANYAEFSKDTGIDIVNNPTLASQPDVAVKTALWYLKKRKLLSKAAAGDIKGLTKGINGGFNGLDDRIAKTQGYLTRFAKGIDVVNTPSAAAGGGSMVGRVADAIGGSMAGTAQVVGSAVGISPDTISAGTNAVGNAITSAGNAVSSAGSAVAGAVVNMSSSLKTILDSITDELVALGKSHFRLKDSSVTLEGMNETFMKLFWAMLGESKKKGGPKVQINDGFRSLAEQTRLWNLYKSGQKKEACARPGTSRHGFGVAIDINTVNANWLDKSGLLAKYGFERPLLHLKKPETWHVENKFIKKGGMPTPVIGKPKEEKTDKKPAGSQPVIAAAPTGNDSPSAATPVPVQDQPGVVQNTTVPAVSSIEANNGVTVASMTTNKINEGMSKLGKSLDSAVDNIPVDKLNIGKALISPGQAVPSGKPVDNSSSAGNAEAMFDISKSMQETMTKQLSALLSISDILKSIEAKVGGGQTTASTSKPSNAKEEAVKPTQRTEGIPGRQAISSPNNRVDLSRKLNVENEL